MKILKATVLTALLFICGTSSQAQTSLPINEPDYNKPKIFSDLPEKLILNITELESMLTVAEGAQINKTLATGFTLSGTVVSKADDGNVKSIVIRSINRPGAAFTFTRTKTSEGTVSYTGRMFSKNAGDAFVIEKDGANYILRKKSFYDLINE